VVVDEHTIDDELVLLPAVAFEFKAVKSCGALVVVVVDEYPP
jgi:hypothetical protein